MSQTKEKTSLSIHDSDVISVSGIMGGLGESILRCVFCLFHEYTFLCMERKGRKD